MNDEVKKKRHRGSNHGMTKTRFYKIWADMKSRCSNRKNKCFHCYGGRGISVCERWMRFESFYEDTYESYVSHGKEFGEMDTTIDRVDNEGNYELRNYRWATMQVQRRNTRRSVFIEAFGKKRTISEWSKITGVPRKTISRRLKRGLTPEECFSKKKYFFYGEKDNSSRHKNIKGAAPEVFLTLDGKTQGMVAWSKELGINYSTLRSRVGRGLSHEECLKVKLPKQS